MRDRPVMYLLYERGCMFDKRLFSLAPGVGRLVAAKVVCMWIGLLANIAFVIAVVHLLENLLFGTEMTMFAWRNGIANLSLLESGTNGIAAVSYAQCVIVMVVAAIVRFLMTRTAAYFGTESSERVKLALREKLFNKMLALGPSYSQRTSTADVVQSAGEGIEQIQSFFELFLPQLFYAVLAPVTLFFVVAPVNMPSAVTLLVCAPLIVLIVGFVAMRAARVFKQYWGKYTDMGSAFLDNLQGLETLKTFDADERAAREMDEKAERFRTMTMNVLQIQLRSLTAMDVVAYGGAAAGVGVAIWQYAIGGAYTASGLPAFLRFANIGVLPISGVLLIVLLSADFFIPLRQLGSFFHVAMNGMTSTKRIFALLDVREPERGTTVLPAYSSGVAVSLRNVSFRYNPDEEICAVKDASFTAEPGCLTAIVGQSGSGKTTTSEIIIGALTGYEGSVTLAVRGSGVVGELNGLTLDSLRWNLTMVGARSHLFAGTLRENLLMARPDATDEDLWRALDAARIADFVHADPQGLDLHIQQDAANLSGGQRQRIAIARALLRGSAIYVFDEATSSVDVESEALILQTIRDLANSGKTVIMVTHRMANAMAADHVVVFDHGQTVEQGNHADLMELNGVYASLFHAQEVVERFGTERASAEGDSSENGLSEIDSSEIDSAAGPDTSFAENTCEAAQSQAVQSNPQSQAVQSDLRIALRLLREVGPLRKYMIIACACGILGHLAATFLPVFGMAAAFAVLGLRVWNFSLPTAIAGMAVCALIRGGMRYAEQYMNHNVAFRLLALFRTKAFAALRRLAPAKLSEKGKGDLIALITTDVELLEIFFAHTISPIVIAVTTTVIYAIALATLTPALAVTLIIAHITVGIVLPKLFALAVRGLGARIRAESAALDDEMLDDMRGIGEIIRFGQGESRLAVIVAHTRSLWANRARLSDRNGDFAGLGAVLVMLFTAIAAFLAISVPSFVMYSSIGMQVAVRLDTAKIVAAFVLFASSFGPTLALSALPANLTQTFASARRLFALMDEAPAVEEAGTLRPEYHGMAMRDVTFGYGTGSVSDAPVLSHVSIDVPKHGILGIQGTSGRGKSTLLKLLMRYWDPQSGVVELSGVPLPQVDASWRRDVQTMMGQETYLFDGTIRENLMIALPASVTSASVADAVPSCAVDADGVDFGGVDADGIDRMLRDALEKASVLDLVDSLPEGLDTRVGELGDRLSEGERQRIGLARIFLRNADLVLFDEPTSRLDSYNESVILRSIDRLAQDGSAVVLVSHRDSTMRIAQHVIRM